MGYAVGEDRSDFQSGGRPWAANDFGFTKFTESDNWKSRTAKGNWARMRSEGVARGGYHFLHPAVSGVAQANYFLSYVRACGGWSDGDMFACDAEISLGDGMEDCEPAAARRMDVPLLRIPAAAPHAAVGSAALQFCRRVAQVVGHRCPVLLYTYAGFLSHVGSCNAFPLWVADFSSSPPSSVRPWSRWTMWQNADHGGQGGGDTNRFNGSRAQLHSWLTPPPADWTQEAIMALPTLKLGDQDRAGANQAVGKMQALLSFVGTKNGLPAAAGLKQDGKFGQTTLDAVKAVQAFFAISGGGGQCGQRTWEHLIGG